MRTFVSKAEFTRRKKVIAKRLEERNLSALCLFSPNQIFYLTGFSFLPTERPISLIYYPGKDRTTLYVPLLEREHAEKSCVDEVQTYPDYPRETHPMKRLGKLIHEMGLERGRIGVDSDGYIGGWGYTGPNLSAVVNARVILARDVVEKAMWIKSSEEIALLQESAKWGNLAHNLLQKYTKANLVETSVSIQASYEASMCMINTLGAEYRLTKLGLFPAYARFRGQVGSQSAIPHVITTNTKIQAGDILITDATSDVGGYMTELERTMVVHEPTKKQEEFFNLMLEAQDLAFEAIKPGIECSAVDKEVTQFFKEKGITEYWRHHTGHGLGIGMHESPFLDIGDHTIIEPGMVFSVEPGIYVPGFAGFRHSDTVVVLKDGIKKLTYYPRKLDDLVILN